MSKQLLIYQSAVPVSAARHANVCLQPGVDFAFSAGINAVPLMAVEFQAAAREYPLVFTQQGDEVMPAAVLGVRSDENLFVDRQGRWQGSYIPAFVRRYPFVFSGSADGKTLTLCVDEAHPGFNREGRGERLFADDRQPTPFVTRVLEFLQEYQAHFERTRAFCQRVRDLGILEPMQAQVTTPQGDKHALSGFLSVNRDRLRELSPDALSTLARVDELELLYLQLHSMANFERVKDRLINTLQAGTPPEAAAVPAPAVETVQ